MNGTEHDAIQMQTERRIDNSLQTFSKHDFEDWLRQGLENHLLRGMGPEAFPGASVDLARYDYPAEGLAATYSRLSPDRQSYYRLAVADLINSLEISEEDVILMETLLHLAVLLPAKEVLRGLPFWLRAGYLQRLPEAKAGKLFDQIFMTVARLATPAKESINCLREMIALPQYTADWAGMALEVLWSCDGDHIIAHFQRLRPYLQELMTDAPHRPRIWAKRMLDAVGLYSIVKTLPKLKYLDLKDEWAALDIWLPQGLLTGEQRLVECWNGEDGQLCFRLAGQPNTEEILELGKDWSDFYHYLIENNMLYEPASQWLRSVSLSSENREKLQQNELKHGIDSELKNYIKSLREEDAKASLEFLSGTMH
jgi:hypothetical protein